MSQYRVRNWSEYNKSLKNRGSLSFWLTDDAVKKWKAKNEPRAKGAPKQYPYLRSDFMFACGQGNLSLALSAVRGIHNVHLCDHADCEMMLRVLERAPRSIKRVLGD